MVYSVEKSYVDKLVARNPLHFNLLSTSTEFWPKPIFIWSFIHRLTVSYDMRFDSSETGNNLESSVVVQEFTGIRNKSGFVQSFVKLR